MLATALLTSNFHRPAKPHRSPLEFTNLTSAPNRSTGGHLASGFLLKLSSPSHVCAPPPIHSWSGSWLPHFWNVPAASRQCHIASCCAKAPGSPPRQGKAMSRASTHSILQDGGKHPLAEPLLIPLAQVEWLLISLGGWEMPGSLTQGDLPKMRRIYLNHP